MKLGEMKTTSPTMTENIEMKLFSSEELCTVITTQEQQEEHIFHQRHLEHPLVPDCDKEPEPEVQTQVQTHPGQQDGPRSEPPAREETEHCTPVPSGFMEEIEIEMEVLPSCKVSGREFVELLPNKVRRVKWRRLVPQRTGLVVKDVVCLPREPDLAQLERHLVPQGKERAALVTMGTTARITIDYSWSANQMESRLALLFREKFARQRFSFVYLQCLQGSRVLFVPNTPADGWTGEQVLRISGHGPLYIFVHQDEPQAECEKSAKEAPVVSR
nr:PREDICTED: uncharacterized protein LOC109640741 [Paralichthys olivaceus]